MSIEIPFVLIMDCRNKERNSAKKWVLAFRKQPWPSEVHLQSAEDEQHLTPIHPKLKKI